MHADLSEVQLAILLVTPSQTRTQSLCSVGARCHHFSTLTGCLQTTEMPFPHRRQGTMQRGEPHPTSTSLDPALTLTAVSWGCLLQGLPQAPGSRKCVMGCGGLLQRPALFSPWKPLYFAINELRGLLMS